MTTEFLPPFSEASSSSLPSPLPHPPAPSSSLHRRRTRSPATTRKGKARALAPPDDECDPSASPLRRTRSTPTRPRPPKPARPPRRQRTLGPSASSPRKPEAVVLAFDSSESDGERAALPPAPQASPAASLRRRRPRLSLSLSMDRERPPPLLTPLRPGTGTRDTDSGYASAADDASSCASTSSSALVTDEDGWCAEGSVRSPELQATCSPCPESPARRWWSSLRLPCWAALAAVALAVLLSLLPRSSPLRPRPISPAQFWGSVPSASASGFWWSSRSGWLNVLLTGPLGLSSPLPSLASLAPLALLLLLPRDHLRIGRLYASWFALLTVRLALGQIFCRGTGWAFPALFWTGAAGESSAGLAPLMLAEAAREWVAGEGDGWLAVGRALLAAVAMVAKPWWGGSALLAGALLGAADAARRGSVKSSRLVARAGALLLPLLLLAAPWAQLHASHAVEVGNALTSLGTTSAPLVTVLLMTAPRPGHPAFLLDTLASYLSGFPAPGDAADDRFRIVVYTHFASHPVFDAALSAGSLFPDRPDLDTKAEHYVRWIRRSPLDGVDRLDQRLHLARALQHVAESEDEGEYVMLAEDDFPLCHEEGKGWGEVVRLVGRARLLMPDLSSVEGEEVLGHCGLFVGTGGSGLLIRRSVARALPSVLLGDSDAHAAGAPRERLALSGGLDMRQESPPDIAIQRCLLGLNNSPACSSCAVPVPSSALTLSGMENARQPWADEADPYGKAGLAVSERLVMRHLGYNASTVPDRSYKPEEWGCGWRHPFNGDASVLVLR